MSDCKPHRTRVRITLDFDVDTVKARNRFPDVELRGEEAVDGVEVYFDHWAMDLAEWTRLHHPEIDTSPVHFNAQLNPPESEEF